MSADPRETPATPGHTPNSPWAALALGIGLLALVAAVWAPVADRWQPAAIAEANHNLHRIARAAKLYYETPQPVVVDGATTWKKCQLPAAVGVTPTGLSCCLDVNDTQGDDRCDVKPGVWQHKTWKALGFSIGYRHHYQYSFCPDCGAKGGLVVTAQGDRDCDGVLSELRLEALPVVGKDGSCAMVIDTLIQRDKPYE